MEKELKEIFQKAYKERKERADNDIRNTLERLFDKYCVPKIKNIREIAKNDYSLELYEGTDPRDPFICGKQVDLQRYLKKETYHPSCEKLFATMKEIIEKKDIPLKLHENKTHYRLYFAW